MALEFLGIDLAWSQRARTGLATVDDDGALIASDIAITDDEIDGWIRRHAPNAQVIAIDAPLVVPNATGQRVCENLIGKAFGRYNASAHVSNQTKPYFNPPRGFELTKRHRWEIDPEDAGPSPLALEVYPHPAMVGLWSLGTTIPYKAKKGRDLDARKLAFTDLLVRLETTRDLSVDGYDGWARIRSTVANATRQVDLERVEDEIDAIFCAHLAWLWHHDRSSLQVYGSLTDGYIVAPPPPTHDFTKRSVATPRKASASPHGIAFDVVGRPTGFGGSAAETAWKKAVREQATKHLIPPDARVGIDLDFRLGPSQVGRNEPDLDNLIKTTIDALEGVLSPRPGNYPAQVDDVRVDEIRARKRVVDHAEIAGVSVKAWVISTAAVTP